MVKSILLALSMALLYPQTRHELAYIESWRKGTHQVREQHLTIRLTASKPKYDIRVRDASGQARYELSIFPDRAGEDILGWMIELVEVAHEGKRKVNLLRPTDDPEQDFFRAEDYISWLCPIEDPANAGAQATIVAFLATRVIKIEAFYCVIEVKEYRLKPGKERMLDSLTLHLGFTNNKPAGT